MELIINLLVALIVTFTPQTSEAPQNAEFGIEMGVDGCPIEEPCWDYEAEEISEMYEAFGYNVEEEAQSLIDNLSVTPSDREDPLAYEYVATFGGGTPEFDETYFTLASPTHEGVEHVIHVVTHWKA